MSAINLIISAPRGEIPSNFRHVSYENLCISASQQPSEEGILWIFQQALSVNMSLHVVDLREESHFFASGHAITYYNGLDNDDNRGLSLEEISTKEVQMIQELKNQGSMTVYGERIKVVTGPKQFIDGVIQKNKNKVLQLGKKQDMSTADVKTEAAYIQTLEGAQYTRIPFTDHRIHEMLAQLNKVTDVVEASIQKRNTWVHFHCHKGKGRAAVALLASHIFMKKPYHSNSEEIIERLISNDTFKNEREKHKKLSDFFKKL